MQKIFTEDPDYEQWQMLSNFIYPSNIDRFFSRNGIVDYDKELLESISGSILQSQEYFAAANSVSLNTSPLLLYYGTVNLMYAASMLVSGKKIDIENHGMRLDNNSSNALTKLGDFEFTPFFATIKGGLFQFCKTFCPDISISQYESKSKWTLLEILGSIPELKNDFEECYDTLSYIIPVQIVRNQNDYVERIDKHEFKNFDVLQELSKILDFEKTYIKPILESPYVRYNHVFLRRKIKSKPITESSVFGQIFLRKCHEKLSHCITLPLIMYMYMGLFVLGYLSRYKPVVWSPFVRNDSTGEKRVIEKFINITKRVIPNIILNFIYKTEFYFVKEIYEPLELSKTVSEDRIRAIFREEINRDKG
ncbi:YaaC family protein [Nostoc sp. ChiSLP03a]|uniref:YaaC family protein n=1 Tax=Nostoc sp. ChiSLP03a TaxID=3075380 RepID=UPI002AD3DF3F|nr:YaaC family protein [Nostoc sp. ChiSLP03a]MDZ8215948.1 YaaC family protein [Nostoc sp. ChiSLP03a]